MATSTLTIELLLAGVAGGMLGAALGALPSLGLSGLVITVGEIASLGGSTQPAEIQQLGITPAAIEATGVSGSVGFGPILGPHAAFAGGVAAAAYLGRQETLDTGFRYHQAKKITMPLGSDPEVLLIGGAFGLLGVLIARLSGAIGLPVDPIMLAVVLSGLIHRLAFGYPVFGRLRDQPTSILDMSPFARQERWGEDGRETAEGTGGRHVVEPWLPDHYEWDRVTGLGVAVGLASGYIALATGSVFLAFGLTAGSLLFLSVGLYELPVTHHMALPASIAAVAIDTEPLIALAVACLFGVLGALTAELAQRLLYAHADTHLDPPAVSIVVTSLVLVVLAAAGVLDPELIPYPTL